MSLSGLLQSLARAESFRAVREQAFAGGRIASPRAVQPVLTALLAAPERTGAQRRLLVITATGQEA